MVVSLVLLVDQAVGLVVLLMLVLLVRLMKDTQEVQGEFIGAAQEEDLLRLAQAAAVDLHLLGVLGLYLQ